MNKHLKNIYGFNKFRDYQKDIINDILNHKDVIAIFPTGAGKSLCYQFPATFTGKKSIIVSPLISLMTDQKMHMKQQGISTVCLNSESDTNTNSRLLKTSNISTNKKNNSIENANLIYCTPEFLCANIEMFKKMKNDIIMFAIDESHIISEWGHDFRISYTKLGIIRKNFPGISIGAFTATATPNVIDDIFNILQLEDTNQYQISTFRDNMSIEIREKSSDILKDLNISENESTIVYTQSRKNAEKISNLLASHGIASKFYHGSMSKKDKNDAHRDFFQDKIKVIVCTVAFALGIDKSNIRKIYNYGPPCNIETYYQEIGRAGRDGLPCKVVLFQSDGDFALNQFLISKSCKFERKQKQLEIFYKYIQNTTHCRQVMIEYYFENGHLDGEIQNSPKCGLCDNCNQKEEKEDVNNANFSDIIDEAKLVVGLVNSLSINYGITKLINILKGSQKYQQTSFYFGRGSHHSVIWWKKIFSFLIQKKYLNRRMVRNYIMVFKGDISLPQSLFMKIKKEPLKNMVKFQKILAEFAFLENVSSSSIISEKILENIAKKSPSTLAELENVDGVNINFIEKYGNSFLTKKADRKSVGRNLSSKKISYELYKKNKSIEEIAYERKLTNLTIQNHVIDTIPKCDIDFSLLKLTEKDQMEIKKAIFKVGIDKLKPINDCIPNRI